MEVWTRECMCLATLISNQILWIQLYCLYKQGLSTLVKCSQTQHLLSTAVVWVLLKGYSVSKTNAKQVLHFVPICPRWDMRRGPLSIPCYLYSRVNCEHHSAGQCIKTLSSCYPTRHINPMEEWVCWILPSAPLQNPAVRLLRRNPQFSAMLFELPVSDMYCSQDIHGTSLRKQAKKDFRGRKDGS